MIPSFLAAATAAPINAATAMASTLKLTPEQLKQALAQAQAAQSFNPSRSPLAQHFGWLTHTFAGIFIVSAVLLIALLAVQTTKQEGLSGTIGGRVESAYRGRLGTDQQIARFTGYIAVTFVVFATILSISGI